MYVVDPVALAVKRAKRLYYVLWAFVIYSVIFTSVAIVILVSLAGRVQDSADRLQDSCESRQVARLAIREGFASDPDWSAEDQITLDAHLPAAVLC